MTDLSLADGFGGFLDPDRDKILLRRAINLLGYGSPIVICSARLLIDKAINTLSTRQIFLPMVLEALVDENPLVRAGCAKAIAALEFAPGIADMAPGRFAVAYLCHLLSNGEQVAAVKTQLEQTIDLLCGGTLKLLEGGVNPDRFKTHLLAAMVADPQTLDKSEFRKAVEFTVKFVCA